MGDPNILVSNGTCYTAAGKKLDESFIPCGNDAFGHQTCCGAGDNCLADKACFGIHGSGYGAYLTYMAGCTDPNYEDGSCPDKKDIASANTAFSDTESLTLFASLPKSTGDSIKFETGHVPTGDPTSNSPAESGSPASNSPAASGSQTNNSPAESGSQSAGSPSPGSSGSHPITSQTGQASSSGGGGSSGASSNNGQPTQTGSGSASSGNNQSSSDNASTLSSGTKIGIGVGVAVGVLILLAIIATILLRRRKRRRSASAIEMPDSNEEGEKKGAPHLNTASADPGRLSDVTAGTENTNTISEADGKPLSGADKPGVTELDSEPVMEVEGQTARPWNMGSELDDTQMKPAHLSPVAELPGSLANEVRPGWIVR
ncbi:hypothetical protein N0V90_012128 [Kalmusia sp. IMI 367209]|nr:hypothetical protein N0V90_012128 [Kalmusia sp. IMI 367209]